MQREVLDVKSEVLLQRIATNILIDHIATYLNLFPIISKVYEILAKLARDRSWVS
jgi:hypothetical protein